jgi:uncharacterized protein YggE
LEIDMNRRYLPLLLAAALSVPSLAAAQQPPRPPHQPRIHVAGEGEASVAPDMAIVSLSVMREAETAREALDQNNTAIAEVIAALKEAGIEARDLQTAGLQINPRYVFPQDNSGEPPRIQGYQVSNTLTVRIRDISKVGEIIDKSVSLGVNQGGSISFTNSDSSATVTEARKRAVKDAVSRATTLAEAAGVKLGSIVEISEHSMMPQPMPISAQAFKMEASVADAVPVEAGENTYRVQVSVTFEIAQ